MPILDRLTGQPDDDDEQQPEDKKRQPPEPKIISGLPGYANFSLAALQERIEAQFQEEIAGRDDILLADQDEAARRELVREAGEYVLAVEGVPLLPEQRTALFDAAYRNLFTFGPLDDLLRDEMITEMTIDGYASIHVRRQMGEPEAVQSYFADEQHLTRIVERILTSGGAQLLESEPFVEVGLTMLGRPARLTLIGQPLSPVLHLDIRLHPAAPTTLDGLRQAGALSAVDETLLTALASSGHGLLIVGDVAAGKTTMLEALLPVLPDPEGACLVERSREVRAPAAMVVRPAVPATELAPGQTFAEQIAAALEDGAAMLIADELRGDEATAIWAALAQDSGPRCIAVLRASTDPARLRSAFDILIRKGQPALPYEAINRALLERLPFVVMTRIGPEGLRLIGIGEWAGEAAETIRLRQLVREGVLTGEHPRHDLPGLPDDFWLA